MKCRSDLQRSARTATIVMLFVILLTPYIVASSPPKSSDEGYLQPASGFGASLPKIDPQLKELIDHQRSDNARVIVVFKHEGDKGLIERITETDASFRIITEFEIIPAVLIEGPLNKISGLLSISEIQGIYLNREFSIGPINKTMSLASSMSPASPWIQAINTAPVRALTNGSGVTVAVVDSGIYASHPDLAGKVVNSTSFVNTLYGYLDNESSADNLGHGTYVAGIVAGGGVLSSEYEGVAPGVKLISARCIDAFGRGFSAGMIKAIEWAVSQGCDVITMSIGGGAADPEDPMCLAVDSAVRSGVIVVVSAGNGGPYYSTGSSPAAARLAISVGASDGTNSIASFSSRGPTLDGRPYPDVLAPGVDIVSTLAAGSAIADYAERLGLSSGNYVSLGGTSASAPLVSGSVALLLSILTQLRRSVVPADSKVEIGTAIRVALMRTANSSIGADVNTYGSGIVNVGSAYTYLKQFGSPLHYPILNVYPKILINPPYLVGFPGDSLGMNISLLTAFKANLTIAVSGNATPYIRLRNSTFTNIAGLTPINVNISIPVNASLARYVAQMKFVVRNSSSQVIPCENVTVTFTVRSPKGRIYFDLFHTESAFSIRSALHKLASRLVNRSFSVYEGDTPITYPIISGYDILVLTDPRIVFSREEVKAIHEFIAENGSLLVLGSYYPGIVAEAVDAITARYGIQYNKDFIANYTDMVTGSIINSLINVTNLALHPVTNNVSSYLFGYGSSLIVNRSVAAPLAYAPTQWSSLPILAAYESPMTGRVVASGSMLLVTDDYLIDKNSPGNLELTDNIVSWLLGGRNVSVEVMAPKTRVKNSESFQIGIVIINRINGNLLASNVTCAADNGSSIPVKLRNDTNGIYYNMTVAFQSQGFYIFRAKVDSNGSKITRTFCIEVVYTPPEISNVSLTTYLSPSVPYPYPTYFRAYLPSGTPIISRFGDYVNITVKASGISSQNSNVTVYLTRFPNFYLSNSKPITYVYLDAKLVNATTHTYNAKYCPAPSNSTDIYLFWVSANSAGHMSLSNEVNVIMVASMDPTIDNKTSTVNNRALSDLGQSNFLTIKTGEKVSVVVNGSDAEDRLGDMSAWAILLDLSLFRIPGFMSAELMISNLTFSSGSSTFTGTLMIPSSGLVNYTSDNKVLSLVNRLFALVLLIVDSDGAYSMDYAFIWIVHETETPFALIFTILLASIAVPIVTIIIIEKRTKRKLATSPQPDQLAAP